jgi:hypothetical protein
MIIAMSYSDVSQLICFIVLSKVPSQKMTVFWDVTSCNLINVNQYSSDMLVNIYQTTLCHIPEDSTESFLYFVDQLTALRFTGTDASLAARRIRILPLNQHALMADNVWNKGK